MISPQLCKSIRTPIIDPGYIMEQKYDGIRAQLTVHEDRYYIETRSGQEITHRFPEIIPSKNKTSYILDGEICHLGIGNTTDFQAIQARVQRDADIEYYASLYPATFIAFDCLMMNNASIVNEPLLYRKMQVVNVVTPNIIPAICWNSGDLDKNKQDTWEGFIYKRKDSLYQPGKRSSSWLKFKFVKRETVWAIGFTHGLGRRAGYFGALVVARKVGNEFVYAGTVGTGYTDLDLDNITSKFRLISDDSNRNLTCRFYYHVALEPFQVEVEYLELTKAGIMRQPSYKGLTCSQ